MTVSLNENNTYYHTSTGIKTAIGTAGVGALLTAYIDNNMSKDVKLSKYKNKFRLGALGVAGLTLLSGYLTDKIRNKRNDILSDKCLKYGIQQTIMNDDAKSLAFSKNKRLYDKSWFGSMVYGCVAGVTTITGIVAYAIKNKKMPKKNTLEALLGDGTSMLSSILIASAVVPGFITDLWARNELKNNI